MHRIAMNKQIFSFFVYADAQMLFSASALQREVNQKRSLLFLDQILILKWSDANALWNSNRLLPKDLSSLVRFCRRSAGYRQETRLSHLRNCGSGPAAAD